MIDAEQLSCFIAVAETRSFVQSADQLGVVQSVVSKRLRRLEDELGAPLVDRSNRRAITLTRVGVLFLAEAREALTRLEAAARVGKGFARGEAGPLRIGYVFSAAMTGLVTRIARRLAEVLPGVDVQLVLMETPDQLAALADGRLDMALTRPRPSYPPGTEAHRIHKEGVILALASGLGIGGRGRVMVTELADQTFIVPQFRESVGLIEHVRALAKKGGFLPVRTIETPDYISAASLAAAGLGVILAPASLQKLGLDGLAFVPIDDFEADFELVLVRRAGVAPGLAEIIIDEFARAASWRPSA